MFFITFASANVTKYVETVSAHRPFCWIKHATFVHPYHFGEERALRQRAHRPQQGDEKERNTLRTQTIRDMKHIMFIAAALLLSLTACQKNAEEAENEAS